MHHSALNANLQEWSPWCSCTTAVLKSLLLLLSWRNSLQKIIKNLHISASSDIFPLARLKLLGISPDASAIPLNSSRLNFASSMNHAFCSVSQCRNCTMEFHEWPAGFEDTESIVICIRLLCLRCSPADAPRCKIRRGAD